jgi:hypothetical protein
MQITEEKIRKKRLNPEETRDEMIENIIKEFDFDKCRRVMKFLNWSWWSVGVPQVEDLQRTARHLMECASKGAQEKKKHFSDPYFCSTGGLKATAYGNHAGHPIFLELEFVLTDWSCDGDYTPSSES